jgi:uncharacterized protein (TIGR02271 family)
MPTGMAWPVRASAEVTGHESTGTLRNIRSQKGANMAGTLDNQATQQGQVYDTGAAIFDAEGQKIGTLSHHGIQNGYLVVHHGILLGKDAYVPLNAIAAARPDGIHLNLYKADLDSMVGDMPPQMAPSGVGGTSGGANTWTASGTDPSGASRQPMTQLPPLRILAPAQGARAATMSGPTETVPPPDLAANQRLDETDQTDVRVPVTEEELVAGTRETERGRVHVKKDVVEEEQTVSAPVTREEVHVERVPVSGASAEPDAEAFQSEDIEIPVKGEELVTGKRARVEDELRVSKRPVTEERQASDTVRKERVNVERVDDQGNVLGDDGEPMGHFHDQAGTEPVNPSNP